MIEVQNNFFYKSLPAWTRARYPIDISVTTLKYHLTKKDCKRYIQVSVHIKVKISTELTLFSNTFVATSSETFGLSPVSFLRLLARFESNFIASKIRGRCNLKCVFSSSSDVPRFISGRQSTKIALANKRGNERKFDPLHTY